MGAGGPSFTLHGRPVGAVFALLGDRENDLTAALGFVLARSRSFQLQLLARLDLPSADVASVRLETADDLGRTDLEIDGGEWLVVVEAKRGWQLPSEAQLAKYISRILARGAGMIVTLSDCSTSFAALSLPPSLEGVAVRHLPWVEAKELVALALKGCGRTERAWLDQFAEYLTEAIRMTDPASSLAYCVSVSNGKPGAGGRYTFREFVEDEAVYFHPYGPGNTWPTEAPTFMAFRWNNLVQQVRRVVSFEVVPELQSYRPDIPRTPETERAHAVYRLGPVLPMHAPLPCGVNYRAARMWVLVDQLLTSASLKDAVASSKVLMGTAS